MVDNSALAFNRSDALTVANVISGTRRGHQGRRRHARSSPAPTPTPARPRSAPARCRSAAAARPDARRRRRRQQRRRWPSTAATRVTVGTRSAAPARSRQIGTGTMTLTGDNTYTGATTISAGTLQVGNGGTTGTLGPAPSSNNAALIFNRSNALDVWRRHQRHRRGHPGRRRHDVADRRQHLQRHDDHRRRHAADRQWRHHRRARHRRGRSTTATLAFNRSNASPSATRSSGTGALRKAGAGTTTLTGDQYLQRHDDDQRPARCRSATAARPARSAPARSSTTRR